MQKITPVLWFDKEAKEAANFYASVFEDDSRVGTITTLTGTPSGDTDIVPFKLWGYKFLSFSAGPYFKPTPAISFMVNFDPSQMKDAEKRIDEMWAKLSEGGKVMMEIGEYPWSSRYGWCADKYGFSWHLILTDPKGEERPLIIPSLLFVTDGCDKAEEATDFYLSVFKNAKRATIARYPAGMEPNKEGAIMFTEFMLEGQLLAAMDGSSTMHKFKFNEAVSFMVNCKDQNEIDYYWEKLSAVPEAEQCGWLKDRYGVSWQIVPTAMDEMMTKGTPEQVARVTQAFLPMKKFDLAALQRVYEEK